MGEKAHRRLGGEQREDEGGEEETEVGEKPLPVAGGRRVSLHHRILAHLPEKAKSPGSCGPGPSEVAVRGV